MNIRKINFQQHGDERGELVALEEMREVPFKIRRVYYMYKTLKGVTRGYHSHKTLEQILVCVSGSCVVIFDDGEERKSIRLDKPYEGIYIGANVWREMTDFSEDAVLLVLASEIYEENDYIRNYNDFMDSVKKK